MGIQTNVYVKDRDAISFLFECKTNPCLRGLESRICDKAMADAWRKMKDGEIPDDFDFDKLSHKNPDKMNERELVWLMDQLERANRHIDNNVNARPRYKKFKQKQTTNL